MKKLDVVSQSWAAYDQWKELWRKHAEDHSRLAPHKPLSDFMNIGIGKSILLVANGYSFEKNLEEIKAHQGSFDVMACDKTLGHLLENGIVPDYCIVCDAQVNYEKYLKPWEDQLENTVLFINVCANSEWSFNGNWKDVYCFVNRDAIKTELEFGKLSQCENTIPAGTNVSNAMAIFVTQSDNNSRQNYFGYDKINLIGFDYSWLFGGKYYAFSEDGNGKAYYMRHIYTQSRAGEPAYTSTNLEFSARWLENYVRAFDLPVVQCSQDTILNLNYNGKLEDQIKYTYKRDDFKIVRKQIVKRNKLLHEVRLIEGRLGKIGQDHYNHFLSSI